MAARAGERSVLPFVRHLDTLGMAECFVDFADTGRLAFVPGFGQSVVPLNHLVWIDRAGHRTKTGFTGYQAEPVLSPDERHVAIVRAEKGEVQIWIYDPVRGTSEQLTRDGENVHPSWSPSGDRLAFSTLIRGNVDLRWCPSDGSAPPRFLVDSDQDEGHWRWLPDGRTGVFERYSPATGKDILMMDEGHPETARTIVSSPLDDQRPAPSPDGGMLAYSGGDTLYVAHLPDMKSRVQIAVGAGFPTWSAKSGELFYVKDEKLFAITCRLDGGRIVTGAPAALFDLPRSGRIRTFDVTADGSRFLFTENDPAGEVPEEVRVIEDGFGELARAAEPKNR